MQSSITAERLRSILFYDPNTGFFIRRDTGASAGSKNDRGYIRITIDGRSYRAHRLAYLYMAGKLPDADVDHKNRDRSDNRWSNLRQADGSQNQANRPARGSASGFRGVYWAAHANCWRAELTLRRAGRRVKKVLGYFHDPALASEFRELAGRMIWGDFYLEQGVNCTA